MFDSDFVNVYKFEASMFGMTHWSRPYKNFTLNLRYHIDVIVTESANMPDSLGDGSAQSSPDSNRLTCGVCSEEIPAYHLGAKVSSHEILNTSIGEQKGSFGGPHSRFQVCRPCAAFYKRAVVEKLKYRCRTGLNNCYLSGGIHM